MNQKMTILQKAYDNGCVGADVDHIIAAAEHLAKKPMSGFPKYVVKVDGEHIKITNVQKLRKVLECINTGLTCEIFRNAGKGCTIDFE